ncbi:unnamed protein product [Brassica napus]|uniref:(rape) hypothetical protein n=1 Tax=Brassica napus TaxID=3708 RepID=A0A816IJ77_BRANA|nr:unnamed protein product [Brassica napus]
MLPALFFLCTIVFCRKYYSAALTYTNPIILAREANEELSKAQATTESNHVYQSIPCGEQIQSLSSTFPPQQTDGGFEAFTKNFKQCEIWNGPQGNNNQEDQIVNTI